VAKYANRRPLAVEEWRQVPPTKKDAKVAEWQRHRSEPVPLFAEWTDDDERTLQDLESEVVIEDTELRKERRRLIQDAPASFALLSEAQRIDLMAKYCAVDPAASHSTSASPSNELAEDNAVEMEYGAADNVDEGEDKAFDFVNDSEQNESDKCSEELEGRQDLLHLVK
jgi:hypothetical protein